MHEYQALSKKETEQVNECIRQVLITPEKKCSAA